ncbi:hypothetical protein [Luteipulveratus mongoliensis]|uniref:hypothetical protein n=1 Tax=Luteipulveratus mongoliensis TaxID=571913 RepID=UPI0012ECF477|nr:hypothetical protein [Luteipulveratus mongoliensis]
MTETLSAGFMERYFGELSQAVATALIAAGSEAHTRSLDAKIGSRLPTNHAYGSTFWLALPKEVVVRLLPILDGAVPLPLRGAPYELVIWEGIAILPVKVMDSGKRNGRMCVRTSELRNQLASVNGLPTPPPSLFDILSDSTLGTFDEASRAVAEAARSSLGDAVSKMVIAAYQCSPKSGPQVVQVGIGTFDEDGYIDFFDSEQLSLTTASSPGTGLTAVGGESFDAASRPRPRLEVVREESTATGEDEQTDSPHPSVPE